MSAVTDAIDLFRSEWAKRFVDDCEVTRYDLTNPTFNEDTGKTEYPESTPYSGGCLARPASALEVEYGLDRRQEVDYDLYLPHDAAELKEGDEVAVDSERDPDIPTLTVLRPFGDSYLTRRHYETKAVTDD
ncbi:MAG: DUF6093 family protein [Actinomycetota bacterium]